MLIPGVLAPRRADRTAVIGTALLASAAGTGYRRIAADLDRPVSTVRRWISSATPAHAEQLRMRAMELAGPRGHRHPRPGAHPTR